MASLFDEEILNVVLKFSNPNERVMENAGKLASALSLSLDQVIRKALTTGKAISEVGQDIERIIPSLNKFKYATNPLEPATVAIGMAQRALARYTPTRLERMSELQLFRGAAQGESSGTASLRAAIEKNNQMVMRKLAQITALPSTREQLMLESVRDLGEEIRSNLQQRLGDFNRSGWAKLSPRERTVLKNQASRASDGVGEMFSKYVVDAIEGGITARTRRPAHSTTYGMRAGSGQSPDVTPGMIGSAAIGLDRRISVINTFFRNMAENKSAEDAKNFLKLYTEQMAHQEKIQQAKGRGVQNKLNIRPGDELAISAMAGVNTRLETKQMIESGFYDPNAAHRGPRGMFANPRALAMDRMLTQPWAKPERNFDSTEIDQFIKENLAKASVSAIKTAAQMASSIGRGDHRFGALQKILLGGQELGRRESFERDMAAQRGAMGSSTSFTPAKRKSVIAGAVKMLADAGLSVNDSLNQAAKGGTMNMGFGSIFEGAFEAFKRRRAARGSSFEDAVRNRQSPNAGPQLDEAVPGEVPPMDIKASMRFDAFQSKMTRLAESVEETTKAFNRFRDVDAATRRDRARSQFESRDLAILRGEQSSGLTYDAQLARIGNRRSGIGRRADAALMGVQSRFEGKTSTLGFAELDAEFAFETAVATQKRRAAQIKKSKAYQSGALQKDQLDEMLGTPVRKANLRLIRAEYANQVSQLTDPSEIEALRQQTAQRMGAARYSAKDKQASYSERVYGLLGGTTLAQQGASQASQISQNRIQQEKELDEESARIEARRSLSQKKSGDARTANAAKLGATLKGVEDDVAKKQEQTDQKVSSARRKADEARVAYAKREAAILGGSGGRPPGIGSGGGRSGGADDFASRSGMHWGLGAAGLVAYGGALKEVIKDTVIYAARTETLQLVTNQMSKVNGLNTEQIEAQVDRIKQLNITTQEAHTTVQKMMFAQLDVAKATNLARTAQDAAILANVNSSEALDKIILGIVTGQTRVLHNMNLQVSMLQVLRELRTSKRAAGEKGEPTELEKRQAMLNKVLLEGAKIMGTYERAMLTAGKQFNSLQREIQETQNAVGQEFLPEFGRAVSVMSSGLRVMRENGDETAKFASALVSLGSAAGTVGSLSFIKWLMSSPAIPWWAKGVGAVAGIATYALMNQDDAAAMSTTASEQLGNLDTNIQKLRKERAKLLNSPDKGSPDWMNTWNQNTAALEALSNSQVAIQKNLTEKLADEYNKRLDDLNDYIASSEGKNGKLSQIWADMTSIPNPFWNPKKMRDDLGVASIPGISQEDIKKEAALRRANKERLTLMPPTMLNRERLEIKSIIAEMQQAEGELVKLDERLSETGSIGLKARKSMGSPREKVQLDYEHQVAQVNKLSGSLVELRKKAEAGDIAAKSKLAEVAKDIGGGSFEVGEKKITDFMARREEIVKSAAEDRDIQLSKISRSNAAQIAQIKEQVSASQIQAQVISGNYASEEQAILKLYQLKQSTAKKVLGLTNDSDSYNKQIAQNEVDRQTALIKLDESRARARRDRAEESAVAAGSFAAGRIMDSPINARDALLQSFAEEFKATKNISDEEKQRGERLKLVIKLRQDLVNVEKQEAKILAETAVARFESQQDVASEIDRIATGKGRSNAQRNLDEIERSRSRTHRVADERFNAMVGLTPSTEQSSLKQQRDITKMKADADATVAIIKELDQQVEGARGRLADYYRMQFQRMERINELQATNLADEANAAFNTHRMRLEYIEKEFEAKGRTIEAEKERSKEIQDAEFDQLQKLLALRKKEIEGIRDAAGNVFDAITRQGGGGIKELVMGQLRVTGRQIFQNIAGETFGSARQTLGKIFPGQETTDALGNRKSTALGRILSGTIFSPSHTEDINKRLANVTADNTTAEKELTAAVQSLDAAMRAATGQAPGASGIGGGVSGMLGGKASGLLGSLSSTGIFGGSDSNNPLIFHGMPGGSEAATFSTTVTAAQKTSRMNEFMGALGQGATGKYNIFDVFSGASSVRNGSGSATGLTGAQRAGAIAGYGALIGGGAMTAFSGFKQGGARGITQGVGGILTAASAIPGPQQPFVMAGALIAGFVSSMMGSAKEKRQEEVTQMLKDTRYKEPVAVNIEMTSEGDLTSYDKTGKVRSTRNSAFPIGIQQNLYRPSQADEDQEIYLPGRVIDPPSRPAAGVTINYDINMPINAIDSKDIMARSKDFAAALQKEIRLTNDVGISLQSAIFGAM